MRKTLNLYTEDTKTMQAVSTVKKICVLKLYLNDTISESGIWENRMYRLIERTEEGESRPLPTLHSMKK